MHWISLIGFFMIINLCQSQPTTFKQFETGNANKGGTFQMGPSNGNNAGIYEPKNDAGSWVHTSTVNVSPGIVMKQEKDGRNTFKYVVSSGNNNQFYLLLPFIVATLMVTIHF